MSGAECVRGAVGSSPSLTEGRPGLAARREAGVCVGRGSSLPRLHSGREGAGAGAAAAAPGHLGGGWACGFTVTRPRLPRPRAVSVNTRHGQSRPRRPKGQGVAGLAGADRAWPLGLSSLWARGRDGGRLRGGGEGGGEV